MIMTKVFKKNSIMGLRFKHAVAGAKKYGMEKVRIVRANLPKK